MITLLHNLWRKCGGTAAVEFAIAVPVMLLLFMGTFELSQALIVYMKVIDAADTVSDLVAQQTGVTTTTIGNFYTAAQLVMTPSAPAGLGVAVASVTFDPSTGVASEAWQVTEGGAATMTNDVSAAAGLGGACPPPGGETTPCDSVIVAQASYTYYSPLSYVIQQPITMSAMIFSRPRNVFAIPCTGCPG